MAGITDAAPLELGKAGRSNQGGAVATESLVTRVSHPIAPGVEMEELARFFRDVSWTGTIVEKEWGLARPR